MADIRLQTPQVLWLLPPLVMLLLALAWRRRLKPFVPLLLRLIIAALAVLALARPIRLPPAIASDSSTTERLVLLVDQSASLGELRQALRSEAVRLAQASPESEILVFADRPVLLSDPRAPMLNKEAWELRLNPEISNLAEALSLGARLLAGQPGRLVLLSDGLATDGDTQAATARLAQLGIPVDVISLAEGANRNDVRLVDLSVPAHLRQGETFVVELTLHSPSSSDVTLNVSQDGTTLAEDLVSLEPGFNDFSFQVSAEEIGFHTFRATVADTNDRDAQPANNSFSAFTQVYASPRILVVGDDPRQTTRFARQLRDAGFAPDDARPAELPSRLSELEPFDGLALLDVSARALELEQMIAVQEFVRSLGRGLTVTGGRNSFSLGQYEDTPLAEVLPVSLEPPPREERPPVALLLMLDHSGSMSSGTPTKLAMAKEAAIRATDILGPEDLIGMLVFDHNREWIIPFQQVQDGAAFLELQRRIATIPRGGGTQILPALEEGLSALGQQEDARGARHAVLLTDGNSFDGPNADQRYDALIDAAREGDITLSTIAIGTDADEGLLMRLAERGLGRYHLARQAEELPDLTIAESAILSGNVLQEGEYLPAVFMPHPLLRGLFPVAGPVSSYELPALRGYIGLTPKPRAEMVLQVGPGDPLLSVWGYGLGRAAAWTSDTGDEWAGAWLAWPDADRFWGQLVGYTLPAPDMDLLQLDAHVGPDNVVALTAVSITPAGQPVDLARTRATVTTPAGRTVQLNLVQVAPGRYEQRLRVPDPGAYQLLVTQARTDGVDETGTIGFVVPYPAEYGLAAEGTGEPLLRDIATATGGRLLALGASLLPDSDSLDGNDGSDARDTLREPLHLWPRLLLAALILWPIEIAWRRWARLRIQ